MLSVLSLFLQWWSFSYETSETSSSSKKRYGWYAQAFLFNTRFKLWISTGPCKIITMSGGTSLNKTVLVRERKKHTNQASKLSWPRCGQGGGEGAGRVRGYHCPCWG